MEYEYLAVADAPSDFVRLANGFHHPVAEVSENRVLHFGDQTPALLGASHPKAERCFHVDCVRHT
jgi:hypothetical protein